MDNILKYLKESFNQISFEESAAPGLSQLVGDIDELPEEDEIQGLAEKAKPQVKDTSIPDAQVKDIDPMDIVKAKTDNPDIKKGIEFNRKFPAQSYKRDKEQINPETGKPYTLATRPQKLIHSSTILKVLTPDGKEIDEDKLKELISVRPKQIISQNSKLASSGAESGEVFYDLTLPAYQGLFYNEKQGKFQVVKTCPSASACTTYCYAARGGYIQYEGPWLSATRLINYLMNDYVGFKNQVISELENARRIASKKGTKVVLRFHDSGDFFSESYLLMAYDIARSLPDVKFYAYTKQVDLVNKHEGNKPSNFILNYSKGGSSDKNVDFNKEKHSKVVPYVLFKDLEIIPGQPLGQKEKQVLKDRISYHYKLDPATLITYDELVKIPQDNKKNKFYNVIVKPKDGDDAAAREDVLGTYLLIH